MLDTIVSALPLHLPPRFLPPLLVAIPPPRHGDVSEDLLLPPVRRRRIAQLAASPAAPLLVSFLQCFLPDLWSGRCHLRLGRDFKLSDLGVQVPGL